MLQHTFTYNKFFNSKPYIQSLVHILHTMIIFHSYMFVTKLKVLWVHFQSSLPCIFHPKAYFLFSAGNFFVYGQVFSDGDGAACCVLERVSIRRPAHWILSRPLTSTRHWDTPWIAAALDNALWVHIFLGPLTHLECHGSHFVDIVLHSNSWQC